MDKLWKVLEYLLRAAVFALAVVGLHTLLWGCT